MRCLTVGEILDALAGLSRETQVVLFDADEKEDYPAHVSIDEHGFVEIACHYGDDVSVRHVRPRETPPPYTSAEIIIDAVLAALPPVSAGAGLSADVLAESLLQFSPRSVRNALRALVDERKAISAETAGLITYRRAAAALKKETSDA